MSQKKKPDEDNFFINKFPLPFRAPLSGRKNEFLLAFFEQFSCSPLLFRFDLKFDTSTNGLRSNRLLGSRSRKLVHQDPAFKEIPPFEMPLDEVHAVFIRSFNRNLPRGRAYRESFFSLKRFFSLIIEMFE